MGCRARLLVVATMCVGCPAEPPAFPGAATDEPGDDDGSGDDDSMASTDTAAEPTSTAEGGETTEGAGADTTAAASTDTAPTTTDPSGDPPPSCGDGVQEPDEHCDDANASEIDGCTTSCEIGPIGLDIGERGRMTTIVNFGGPAAMVEEASCPDGQVLIGLTVHADSSAILGVGGRCGSLDLVDADPTSVDVQIGADLTVFGTAMGSAQTEVCPPGQVLGQIAAAGDSPSLTGLAVWCRALVVTGTGSSQALTLEAGETLEVLGPGMPFSNSACQGTQVATTLRVPMVDGDPAGIGLRCSPIALTYP